MSIMHYELKVECGMFVEGHRLEKDEVVDMSLETKEICLQVWQEWNRQIMCTASRMLRLRLLCTQPKTPLTH